MYTLCDDVINLRVLNEEFASALVLVLYNLQRENTIRKKKRYLLIERDLIIQVLCSTVNTDWDKVQLTVSKDALIHKLYKTYKPRLE